MKDIAEILCFKTYGITCYQVNRINVRTGMYYNSSSRYFDTLKEVQEYVTKNNLDPRYKTPFKKGYYVLKQCHEWQYVPELGQSVWVETSAEQVTPYRATKQEAEQDYAKLGFPVRPTAFVQCNDHIVLSVSWTRYIVQCGTIL
jgi:hypothetical protein